MKDEKEWLRQAADDMKSAEVLLKGGRYTHCVFFCHLAIEKALKGVYLYKLKEEPPKIHNLNFFIRETGIRPPDNLHGLITELAMASVPTRYPEELRATAKEYTKITTSRIHEKSLEVVKWISDHLKEL